MRRLLPVLAIIALSLLPLRAVLGPSLPCSDDVLFHLFRLVQLDELLRQGVLYSRWAPDMALGYGYPLFNFYAPLAYYLAALVSRFGFRLDLALQLTFALAILTSGLAMYRLARDHFRRPAALVAAVAYIYAPYQSYDALFRGNLAEAVAWPLLPLALWCMGRLVRNGGGRWLAATAVAYAAILLTHNIFALIFTPLLLAYGLFLSLGSASKGQQPTANSQQPTANDPFTIHNSQFTIHNFPLLPLLPFFLGLGLATFFWLPALAERSYVFSDRLLTPPQFVYWNHFLTLAEIWVAPRGVAADLLNPSPPRALGLVYGLLALPGLALLWTGRAGARRHYLFFALFLLAYVFMMTAVSRPLWDHLPLAQFVQFPWRLLGPAALCLALLIAGSIEALPAGRAGQAGAILATVLLIVGSLAWLDARYCPSPRQPTVAAMQTFELQTNLIGTTSAAEYTPRAVTHFPAEPARRLFAGDALPPTARFWEEERRGNTITARLETPIAGQVTANVFAYPGWRAWVNDRPVTITPGAGHGLITFPVPAGQSELRLRFTETPLRRAANLLSLLSLLLVGAVLLVKRDEGRRTKDEGRRAKDEGRRTKDEGRRTKDGRWSLVVGRWPLVVRHWSPCDRFAWLMIALGLTLSLSVIYLLPRFNTPLYRAELSAGPLAARQESPWLRLADGLVLLAARPEAAAIAADRPLAVDLFWTVTGPPVGDYLTTLLLLDDEGRPWSDKSSDRPGAFRAPHPTYTWRPGVYAVDSHLVQPLPGTPPGVYRLHLIVFDRLTLWPLAAETSPGAAGPLYLGDVIIERPRRPPSPESLTRQYETDVAWGPLRLLGYDLDRAEARPGDPFLLTTYWQATAAIPEPVTAVLTLRADGGQVAFSQELPPVRADFPTTQWRPGDTWRGQHSFRLPAALAGGLYQWQLQICPAAVACRPDDPLAELSGLRLDAPLRLWQAPPPQLALAATFGDMISLLGVDWEPAPAASGVAGRIRLAWRAERDMVVSYRVFVHLLAEGGQIVAQSDGEPGQWQRPTTGWLPGEIVLDEHLLIPTAAEPAPVYTLAVGLYDAASGLRLALPDGGTAVTIDIQTIPGATP